MEFTVGCPYCNTAVPTSRAHVGADHFCTQCGGTFRLGNDLTPIAYAHSPTPQPRATVTHAPLPAPQRTSGGGAGLIVASLAVALLLAGGGVAAWVLYTGAPVPEPAPGPIAENIPAVPAQPDEPAPPNVPGPEQAAPPGNELAGKAQSFLTTYCHRCHGQGGSSEGGLNFILRRDKLAEGDAYITPGSAADSYLLDRIADGDMPPEGESPRPTPEEIAAFRAWIDAGAPNFASDVQRPFIAHNDTLRMMRDNLEASPPRDRRFVRYITLTHLYNAGLSDDEMLTYRLALVKLINSLSWKRELVHPEPIDPAQTVLRIDLRDLDWTAEVWNRLVNASPYSMRFDTFDARQLVEGTGTQVPQLRGDWFVFAASKGDLYYQTMQLPDGLDEFQKLLKVDFKANAERDRVARAGFARSGVSQNNRLIERHESQYGAVWVSYDFAGNTGRQNLFDHPLGPGPGDSNFKHDGGEIIFSLPNGMQGYLLVDAEGKRLTRGPTSIVSDPKQPDRVVVNAVSCMSCHYGGIIPKSDEIRAHVEANRAAFPEAEDILALYPRSDELAALQAADQQRFEETCRKLGLDRLSETGEPIVAMAKRFDANLDLRLASSELGLSPEEFSSRLRSFPTLARKLGLLLVPGGTIKREVFVAQFANATRSFSIGQPLNEGSPATPVIPANPTNPPAGTTDPVAEATKGLRPWSDSAGKKLFDARFVSFDGVNVKLNVSTGFVITVPIDSLGEVDQRFVLGQPAGAVTLDLPPGLAATGTEPKPPPVTGQFPPVAKPKFAPRVWTPTSGEKPFEATFVILLSNGMLKLRLPDGEDVYGPINLLSKEDQVYVQEKMKILRTTGLVPVPKTPPQTNPLPPGSVPPPRGNPPPRTPPFPNDLPPAP